MDGEVFPAELHPGPVLFIHHFDDVQGGDEPGGLSLVGLVLGDGAGFGVGPSGIDAAGFLGCPDTDFDFPVEFGDGLFPGDVVGVLGDGFDVSQHGGWVFENTPVLRRPGVEKSSLVYPALTHPDCDV